MMAAASYREKVHWFNYCRDECYARLRRSYAYSDTL